MIIWPLIKLFCLFLLSTYSFLLQKSGFHNFIISLVKLLDRVLYFDWNRQLLSMTAIDLLLLLQKMANYLFIFIDQSQMPLFYRKCLLYLLKNANILPPLLTLRKYFYCRFEIGNWHFLFIFCLRKWNLLGVIQWCISINMVGKVLMCRLHQA